MRIEILRPDNFHVHFRENEMMRGVVNSTSSIYRRALVMPNTNIPILTAEQALKYKKEIVHASKDKTFEPLMTIKLTSKTDEKIIADAKNGGVTAAKLYPSGATTNSHDGIEDWEGKNFAEILKLLNDYELPLCVHAEDPNSSLMDREKDFLQSVADFLIYYPKLKIVIEHLSTWNAVDFIRNINYNDRKAGVCRLAGTITPQHLTYTVNDILCHNGRMNPHRFCYPIFKTDRDRQSLIDAATKGEPWFFAGDDSAPHSSTRKESGNAPPGCFVAPVSLPMYAEIFNSVGRLDRLENFMSLFGALFYSIPQNTEKITLGYDENLSFTPPLIAYKVEREVDGYIVPVRFGEKISWHVV